MLLSGLTLHALDLLAWFTSPSQDFILDSSLRVGLRDNNFLQILGIIWWKTRTDSNGHGNKPQPLLVSLPDFQLQSTRFLDAGGASKGEASVGCACVALLLEQQLWVMGCASWRSVNYFCWGYCWWIEERGHLSCVVSFTRENAKRVHWDIFRSQKRLQITLHQICTEKLWFSIILFLFFSQYLGNCRIFSSLLPFIKSLVAFKHDPEAFPGHCLTSQAATATPSPPYPLGSPKGVSKPSMTDSNKC